MNMFDRKLISLSPSAIAIRHARDARYFKMTVRCPYGVRHGEWLATLTKRELYEYYFRLAHGHAHNARRDPTPNHYMAARAAKKYFGYCAAVRKGEIPHWESPSGKKIRIP
jgi:hypothetical protein